ncbi:MAG: fused MFS/spermidine synthase [bacterium]|nr:fused MFS/spermidine synthase [bacterium]
MNTFLQTLSKRFTIPFFVFITGGCVLIIEVVAIRILSPYYGNTIFTVSSVISVVLLALSVGYFFGGKLADKHPKESLFYNIIALSGFAVIFLYLLGMVFLANFGYQLSIVEGPIVSSLLLFFPQSFLLGLLSPFAIKLQKQRMEELGVGSVSGQIFFWSTLGSISGSLGAGFFLIPHFGIDKIMLSVGFLLIVLGLFGNITLNFRLRFLLILVLLFSSLSSIGNLSAENNNVLYSKDGVYQKITIFDDMYYGRKARFLFQDKNSSAAEYLDTDEMAYEYTKYYALHQIFKPELKEALVIGGGAYSVPKALVKDFPDATVDVAEIEPKLLELAKEYFNFPKDANINNEIKDGRRFLYDSDKKYDLIFSDAYSSFFSIPEHLTTQEFFTLAKESLSENGVFIANIIGNITGASPSFALSEIKTFKSVFGNSYFFAAISPDADKTQNIIFVGYNSNESIDINELKVKNHKNPIINGLSDKMININKFDFSEHQILTDNHAPVDYLISKELQRMY